MEAEAACDAEDKMHPMEPGPENSTLPQTALEPRPDDVATVSKIAARPASEKPFPFLNLPPEIRNMVYRHSRIYKTAGSWRLRASKVLVFPDLRQAPITRVNKQIRNETLPIFYGTHKFLIELPRLPKAYDGPNEDQDPLKHVWEMLYAFTPDRNSTLQANSLRFLSHLTFRTETQSSLSYCLDALGFTMSSGNIVCDDEGAHMVETAGLNWNRSVDVKKAYLVAIDSCVLARDADDLLDVVVVRCRGADKAANELAALMCYISRQCPQLTSNVLAFVEPCDDLYKELEDISV